MDSHRDILLDLFKASVEAALPATCLPQHLPQPPKGRTLVVGAGKAAASMAKAVEEHWSGPLSGLVITRYDHGVPLERIELVEAAHPVPDDAGRQAARRILEMAQALGPEDLMLCLISGGGSALLALPADGVTLEDKQQINKSLLRSGATISEMNCVRKHLSAIKGGRLAAAASPAQVVTLLISDVPGDDPSVIASGPTVADPTTFADALSIVRKYGIEEPKAVLQHLERGAEETPKPGDERLERTETVMLATAQDALEAAAAKAQSLGYRPLILGNSIEGESRDVASVHAAIALQIATHGQPAEAPCVLLSGGETTVTVKGSGRGGRDAEFLLALAVALESHPRIHAIACDTDGIDGTEDNAGALLDPGSLGRAEALGLKAVELLNDNNGYHFFSTLDDLVVTGPTRTNVNDFRAILIDD
ncbi:MAG: glycerate kinase [Candidatus Thiodiazotropha sp. (ex Ctena orbiculata)]|uniref:Glycerate kinase n=1 Tax=Candidatus Thiodiazotropha taylori TaxID=2792791 RepID=A0A944M7M8_9GAMM|nr:glycerate kinase [Candidatus Thiodiazotropha taylori]PUB88071.1 MAG: glycerate kinase [gamma proteobacterium symbiont of Ctena orbiculata]MBT2987759.1 glycerate kinase [Candidatus Thiodiazotropha taylori]MBT2995854.1 glycerate kinase [Candidatus Thiodiazotropha taylori]MBT2999169.1 glycerate kinase [Candidatus Thiodiazotropha taylori]